MSNNSGLRHKFLDNLFDKYPEAILTMIVHAEETIINELKGESLQVFEQIENKFHIAATKEVYEKLAAMASSVQAIYPSSEEFQIEATE